MKYLTLDDLVKFCEEEKIEKFDSSSFGKPLVVRIPAQFELKEANSSTLFANIQFMHTGRNKNGSNVTEDCAKECMSSLAYKPLLANFCEIDGVKDFTSHDFTVNDDGTIEYQEHQIGCFTADEPYMEDDEKVEGRKNCFARVAIPREYSDAAEIIERKNGTLVSVELELYSISYDSKEKELIINSAEVYGCTCLGKNPETGADVKEGMENSHIQLEDFSVKDNTKFELNDELKQFIQASIEEAFNNKFSRKEDNGQMNKFEELLAKYEKTVEDITFEYEGLDDEALEKAFAEAFDGEGDNTPEENNEPEPQGGGGEKEAEEDFEAEPQDNFAQLSVTINGETKTFSASLVEKLNALYNLVNETYSESDNDWYDVDADEENKEVYMNGLWSGKHYKQKYSVKKDVFSLQGDRVECFAKLLTADEIKQLETLKSNYAEASDKLAKYEAEPSKMEVLNSEDYAAIAETEEFVAFKAQDAHFDLSVDEVRAKADEMLLSAAKQGKVEFAAQAEKPKTEIGMKKLPINTKSGKTGRYGGIFSKR